MCGRIVDTKKNEDYYEIEEHTDKESSKNYEKRNMEESEEREGSEEPVEPYEE